MIYFDNIQFETEIKYEIYLLKKYLTKHYDEDRAIALLKNNSGDIDKLAYALGRSDITFFCLYFLADMFVVKDDNEARELSSSHYDMWNLLNSTFIEDEYDKINIVVSRGFAKTTVCDTALAAWLICYELSIFTLLIGKKEDDAVSFMDGIKKIFKENHKIIDNFGNLIDKRLKLNATEIEFTNSTYIRAIGSTTSCRGLKYGKHRPSVVIADDAQSETDILTDDARQKKYDRWSKEVEQVGDKAVFRFGIKIKQATKIINIGTVLHNDCLMSRLSRNNDYYTFLRRAIILAPDQTVEDIFESDLWLKCKRLYFNDKDSDSKTTAKQFYEDNKEEMKFNTLWNEKWNCFNDLAIPYWENRMSFMQELMNDATSIGEKWFRSVLTRSKEEIEEHTFIKTMLCIDPASTTNKKSDYTAMVVGSESNNGFTYIRDIIMDKLEFNQYCNKVVELLESHGDITHVYVEKNTFQGSDIIKIKELISKNSKLRSKKIEWINEMQKKNKDEKISTIIDGVNNGQIIFVDENKEAIQQMLDFQGSQYSIHDDFPDTVSECANRLKAIRNSKIELLDRRMLGL